jgi:hypothetical protein
MHAAPKTVNAEMQKSLLRQLVELSAMLSKMSDLQYVGFGMSEIEQGFELMWNATYYSLDKRIYAQIEEDGGITDRDLKMYNAYIDNIADTEFEEVVREDLE